MTRSSGRNTDGTFATGNPGKPRGARHKTTQAVLALMEGKGEAITRKAVALALTGHRAALSLCLDRIAPAPKDAPVSFELPPLSDAQGAAQAMAALIGAGISCKNTLSHKTCQ